MSLSTSSHFDAHENILSKMQFAEPYLLKMNLAVSSDPESSAVLLQVIMEELSRKTCFWNCYGTHYLNLKVMAE